MKNKYFYPIYKLKIKSWIKYWLIKQTEFKGVLSDILEGISFYLTDSLNMKFKMFDIIGRTTQDGNPTPENPIPIKNTGDNGSVNEKVQNKNLFDEDVLLQADSWTKNNGVYSGNFYAFMQKFSKGFNIKFKENTRYTLSLKGYCSASFLSFYINYTDGTRGGITINTTSMKSYTLTSATGKTIKSLTGSYGDGGSNMAYLTEIILTEGTQEVPYVPHEEQNISFPLGEGQKLMEGDYPADDEKVHHVSGEMLFDGSSDENWIYNPTYAYFYITTTGFKSADFCDHYSKETGETLTNNHFRFNPNNGNLYIKDERFTSASSFKTNLATNNIILQGELEEEQTEDFTEEQKTAWEQIKKARTYKNITHISSEDETPALLKIQYWKEV